MYRQIVLFLVSVPALSACRSDKDASTDSVGGSIDTIVDRDGDGYDNTEDCDDNNSLVNPGVGETCDGADNNCDGIVDEGVTSTFYADDDRDGFGAPTRTTEACEAPSGYVSVPNDCDDASVESYPGAPERCDGEDNDCDGTIDEDVQGIWYADADADGHGDPDSAYAVCDPPPGYVDNADDCDDTDESALPGGVEVCDEADNDCDGAIDEEVTTTFYQDTDDDNYGVADVTTESCDRPTGYALLAGDCDDANDDISPNGVEVCDSADNDCDGMVDEDDAVDASTWYVDADADGYGGTGTTRACAQPSGYVDNDDDCDDADASASPGEVEVCDAVDNDCDGTVDEDARDATTFYGDADGDGYGGIDFQLQDCAQPSGYVDNDDDCDDLDAESSPAGTEVCDEADNDCDGAVDEGVGVTWYRDSDGDGRGDEGSTTESCTQPSGYVATRDDCDDSDARISPNGIEVCDEADNDCDGTVDEDAAVDVAVWFLDGDGDGYGDASDTLADCTQPSGYVDNNEDCDDTTGAASPAATESCDGVDNDCDGTVDNDEVVLGMGDACAAESCLEILAVRSDASDDVYWIEPSGGDLEELYCLMDSSYGGGGWTLVAVSSDDGTATWTWNNRTYWETSSATVGSVSSRGKDYRATALANLPIEEAMFRHAPSGIWASYVVGDGSKSLGEIIDGYAERIAYGASGGFSMDDGTLSTSGTRLCTTRMAFNACGMDGYSSACSDGDDTHGPTWDINSNNGCYFDDTNVYGGLGPDYRNTSTEQVGLGFGWAGSWNTGSSGSGTNYMQVYVR